MKRTISLLIATSFCLWNSEAYAQIDCILPTQTEVVTEDGARALDCDGNNPNNNSGAIFDQKYSRQDFWVPDNNTPTITIPLAIHIFQDDLGSGTFTDIPETYTTLQQVVDWVNGIWAGGYAPSDPEPWHTTNMDSKIQFELASRVYFYPGTGLETSCGLTQKLNYVANNFPARMQYLGIYSSLPNTCGPAASLPFPNWHDGPAGMAGTANGLDGYNGIRMSLGINEWNQFSNAVVIAHELGHNLDLLHMYEAIGSDCCHETCNALHREYLPDVFGPNPLSSCWFNSCSGNPNPWTPGNSVTNNIMNGCGLAWPDGYWISDLQAGRVHRALAIKSVKDYALDTHGPEPLLVTEDETWNFEMRLFQDLVIEPGATLTITCLLEMPTAGKIIVKPNARLIVDGGVITTARYSQTFWSGIQVWGTSNQHQFPSQHPTYQGLLVVQNGGIIEHAREAVQLWKPGDWNTIGGVVRTTSGAEFRNCRRAAGFLAYQNFVPGWGIPIWNFSSFSNTLFVVDDDYRGIDDFEAHITMWKVEGVRVRSCVFENLQTNIVNSERLGEGIYTIDAHFTVGAIDPSEPTVFRGLNHGIEARNSLTTNGFVVNEAYFDNNICGVYANSVQGFSVRNSEFFIGHRPGVQLTHVEQQFWLGHRGIFSTESSSITIHDNLLWKSADPSADAEGIVVGYTRDNDEAVFRNEIHDVEYGYTGEGISADVGNNNAVFKGLWFLCNDNFSNDQNFWSRKVTFASLWEQTSHTIRTFQGNSERPADNTFDQQPGSSGDGDFLVTTTYNPITYWHRGTGNHVPIHYTEGWLNPVLATTIPDNNCESKTLSGMGGNLIGVKSYLQSEKNSYGNTRYLYEQLIDGGSTDQVVLEIQQSWSEDAWELRDQLLERSPYLSDTVLREVVRRDIMPEAMLTEILVANPDGTRANGFLRWLQNESGHPLPENLAGMVVASWDSFTYRSALENQMSLHYGEMSAAATELVDHYNNDTAGVRTDSLRWVWQQVRTPGARYAEALSYMQQGHMDSATLVITGLNVEHNLRTPEAEERERMLTMIAFWEEHFSGSSNEQELDPSQVQVLAGIMGEAYDRPASLMSNLLCAMYGECRPPMTGGIDGTPKSLPYTSSPGVWEHLAPTIALKPNPANFWVAIDYKLISPAEDVLLLIQDSQGRNVHSQPLQQQEGQLVWDTRAVAQGRYTVIISEGKDKVKSETLIIQR